MYQSLVFLRQLDGMRKWMTFSYTTNVRAHAGITLQKIKTNKLNQNNVLPCLFVFSYAFPVHFVYLFVFSCAFPIRFVHLFVFSCAFPIRFVQFVVCYFVCFLRAFSIRFVYLFVCLFCKGLSYTFRLAVRFNCIKRAVFKPLTFPAYSTNTVIVIFHKWPPLSSDLGQPFAANGLPLLSFLTCVNQPPTVNVRERRNETFRCGLRACVHCLVGRQNNGQCFIITVTLFPRYNYKSATKLKEQYRSGSPWYRSPERTLIELFD